jgi:hypothetical protein
MSDNDIPLSLIQLQFCRAKAICTRNVPVGHQNADKAKSYAQVESFVRQHVVRHNSGELKLRDSRPCRIITRLSEKERETILRQAKEACLTVSEYIRLTLLKSPSLDPERHQLLLKANFELTKQGTNLNQIAKHLNAGTGKPSQGASLLAVISRSLMKAHMAVRQALAEGRSAD